MLKPSNKLYSPADMTKIIKNEVNFAKLRKNMGIFEFHIQGHKSLGISYECLNEESEAYVYNIFVNSEYINISGYGTKNDPFPIKTMSELACVWNKL
jgi:hypothetical protein